MRLTVALALTLGCASERELLVEVEIPPEVQQAYSQESPGEVILHDVALGVMTTVGALCEPTDEDVVFTWGIASQGCATPSPIEAWIRPATFDIPCGELFARVEGEYEEGWPFVEGEAFSDADPRTCPSGTDTLVLRF